MHRTLVPLTVFLLVGTPRAVAQLSDETRISLVTIEPGDEIYSLWGHSALRIYDPVLGIDIAYNYGTFDFGSPVSFVARFAYGQLDYVLSVQSYPALRSSSLNLQRRTIIEQELGLDSKQRTALYLFLSNNALPKNRTYRYHFLFDNCSTRIRDALQITLGNAVDFSTGTVPEATFRELVNAYVSDRPTLRFFMNLAMGLSVDRPVSSHTIAFLPLELAAAVDNAHVLVDGESQRLVVRSDTTAVPRNPSHTVPWPTIVGWLALGLGLLLTSRQRFLQSFDTVLFGVVGIAGLLIVFLWFVSLHDVTQQNLNLGWAWPTHVAVGLAFRLKRSPVWLRVYFGVTTLTALGVALSMVVLPQSLPAPLVPLLLLIALRSGLRSLPPRTLRA